MNGESEGISIDQLGDRLLLSAPELERLLDRIEHLLTVLVARLEKET